MVEHDLAKVGVASSNLVSRSNLLERGFNHAPDASGGMAEWLCSGLQIRLSRFDSGFRLHTLQRSIRFYA
ncbi:hypothetical protein ALT785_100007 [Alteromonas infernus]